ncbi:MAG: zinc ribbon domain-containing protein [Treponemataceae bacterium]
MSKGPRFFCEHCGAEVSRNAHRCSACGRHFSSILCPKCGFSGSEALFSAGCPSCGYSAPPSHSGDTYDLASTRKVSVPTGSLPFWVYALTVFGLLVVVAAAFTVLR